MLSELRAGFQGSMVNGLENLDIELLGFGRIKGHAKCHEGIGETSTKTDGAMAEVRTTSFRDWVVVDIDDTVQVVGDDLGDIVQLLEVVLAVDDEGREGERGEIAHGGLVRCGIFNDLRAEVRRLDGTQVLLVGFI